MAETSGSIPMRNPMQGGAKTASEKSTMASAMESVKEKAHDIADDASELYGKTKDKVGEWSATAAHQVRDKAQEYGSAIADEAETLEKEAARLIRRYPIPSLLVGFGVGFLLAKVIQR